MYDEYNSLKDILRLTDIKGFTLDLFQEKRILKRKVNKEADLTISNGEIGLFYIYPSASFRVSQK